VQNYVFQCYVFKSVGI